jgi:predicted dehydrogenase
MPAINGLPSLKLAAVATRNEQSAREAAEAFGAERWFSDPFAMISDDRINVITVSVKVPEHRELVLAALDAGKAVYCEAPLGRTVAEAEEMAGAVGLLHTAIGLQARLNPSVRRAAQLISSGKIGRPLNARIVSTNVGFGTELHSSYDYFNKKSSLGQSIRRGRKANSYGICRTGARDCEDHSTDGASKAVFCTNIWST